ncbi:MAG: hypothetical protein H6R10_670 [Rhodocyclaceae bacterium]|nr:hypothetical protein [Rhodocyclaceae bacterium]
MIIYDLCCDSQHRFEGWFRSAEDFDSQLERRLITCPQCDSEVVRRVPSAVAISTTPREGEKPQPESATQVSAALPVGSQALALYRQLANLMLGASEDVGTAFAEEARRIHYNEAPERPIRGQTTDEEYEALQEEGIGVIRLPVIKKEDLS